MSDRKNLRDCKVEILKSLRTAGVVGSYYNDYQCLRPGSKMIEDVDLACCEIFDVHHQCSEPCKYLTIFERPLHCENGVAKAFSQRHNN